MQMLVTKLFLLLNLVVGVYLMTEAEFKIIIHFHQDNNSAAVDESGTDYILDHKNQAAANGIDSSPYGSSWTTRSSWTRPGWEINALKNTDTWAQFLQFDPKKNLILE